MWKQGWRALLRESVGIWALVAGAGSAICAFELKMGAGKPSIVTSFGSAGWNRGEADTNF